MKTTLNLKPTGSLHEQAEYNGCKLATFRREDCRNFAFAFITASGLPAFVCSGTAPEGVIWRKLGADV